MFCEESAELKWLEYEVERVSKKFANSILENIDEAPNTDSESME